MNFGIISVLFIAVLPLAAYAFQRVATRRRRRQELAELKALPPVKMDFSTPEGAILCFENASLANDIDAAVACRDFATEAKLWLKERGDFDEELQRDALPEMTKTMERTFRESQAKHPRVGWDSAQSYFVKREQYGPGLAAIGEITVGPDGSFFRQRILVAETLTGWRVVCPLVLTPYGWKVTPHASK